MISAHTLPRVVILSQWFPPVSPMKGLKFHLLKATQNIRNNFLLLNCFSQKPSKTNYHIPVFRMVWGNVQVCEYEICQIVARLSRLIGKRESSAMWFCLWGIFASAVSEAIRKPTLRLFYYCFKKRIILNPLMKAPRNRLIMMPSKVCCPMGWNHTYFFYLALWLLRAVDFKVSCSQIPCRAFA
jgi:hypothetical protein